MHDPLDALERLARLHSEGVLTDEEFAQGKARLLAEIAQSPGEPNPAPDRKSFSLSRLRLSYRQAIPLLIMAAVAGGALLALSVRSDIASYTRPETTMIPNGIAEKEVGAAGSADLGTILTFDDASACIAGRGLKEVVAQLARAGEAGESAQDEPIRVVGVEKPLMPHVTRVGSAQGRVSIAQIDIEGDWEGLRVKSLRSTAWGDGAVSSMQIRFSDPADEARSVLTQMGFEIGDVGQVKKTEAERASTGAIGVEALPAGSALTCVRDARSASAAEKAA